MKNLNLLKATTLSILFGLSSLAQAQSQTNLVRAEGESEESFHQAHQVAKARAFQQCRVTCGNLPGSQAGYVRTLREEIIDGLRKVEAEYECICPF